MTHLELQKKHEELRAEMASVKAALDAAHSYRDELEATNTRLEGKVALYADRLRAEGLHECMRCGGQFRCPHPPDACTAKYAVLPPLGLSGHTCAVPFPTSDKSAIRQPERP